MHAALLICFAGLLATDPSADEAERIALELDAATAAFRSTRDAASADLIRGSLKEAREAAQEAGDLAAYERLGKEIKSFDESGEAPASVPAGDRRRYERSIAQAKAAAEQAYRTAISDYTRAGLIEKAKATREELKAFKLRDSEVHKNPRNVWVHSTGLFERQNGGMWKEFSSNGNVYVYREIERTDESITIEALNGTVGWQHRLSDHAVWSGPGSGRWKKTFEGRWHWVPRATTEGDEPELGERYVGTKTWTKKGAVRPRGFREPWALVIDADENGEFQGRLGAAGAPSGGYRVSGRFGGGVIEFDGPRLGPYYGTYSSTRLDLTSADGHVSLTR
ncbi:hypothetical protein [Alienimonas chondri]|uniref:Uncharacterized protein n=1 Tax=Alienimonas chondri TaxID=2681879 RepID=A0ABX1VG58_9PLAN|nr:hypothetical protein [Alienimonas chondri]NNJ27102.1 hypothetical protein [Alienimonas chondri]